MAGQGPTLPAPTGTDAFCRYVPTTAINKSSRSWNWHRNCGNPSWMICPQWEQRCREEEEVRNEWQQWPGSHNRHAKASSEETKEHHFWPIETLSVPSKATSTPTERRHRKCNPMSYFNGRSGVEKNMWYVLPWGKKTGYHQTLD